MLSVLKGNKVLYLHLDAHALAHKPSRSALPWHPLAPAALVVPS